MYPRSFPFIYTFLTFLRCTTALSLSTVSDLSAGQTAPVTWKRTKDDPDTFFVSLRKDNGNPLSPTQVDSDGESTGQVAILIPPDLPEGTYLFEGFNTSGPLSQSTPSLAGSNSFNLAAAVPPPSPPPPPPEQTTSSSVDFTSTTVASVSVTTTRSVVTSSSSSATSSHSTVAVDAPVAPPDTSILSATTSTSSTAESTEAIPAATSTATDGGLMTSAPTIQSTRPASPKLSTPIIIAIVFASIIGLVVLLLCFLVMIRSYRRRGNGSVFSRDMMVQQRTYTPSFSNSPIPFLAFDAAPQTAGELQASEEPGEKFPPPDYAWMPTQQTGMPTFSSLVIAPTIPELPPLPSPVVVALPNIGITSKLKDQVSLNSFPLPPSTVPVAGKFQVARLGVPEADKTPDPVSRQRRSNKVANDMLALKRKMLQLKQQGLQDSEVFSEAREKVDMSEVGETRD